MLMGPCGLRLYLLTVVWARKGIAASIRRNMSKMSKEKGASLRIRIHKPCERFDQGARGGAVARLRGLEVAYNWSCDHIKDRAAPRLLNNILESGVRRSRQEVGCELHLAWNPKKHVATDASMHASILSMCARVVWSPIFVARL